MPSTDLTYLAFIENSTQPQQSTYSFQGHSEQLLRDTRFGAMCNKSQKNFKSVQAMQHMFSNHNGIKLEINDRKVSGKYPPNWRLSKHTFKESIAQRRNTRENYEVS